MPHGGKREGAGRKPRNPPDAKPVWLRLTPEEDKAVRELVEAMRSSSTWERSKPYPLPKIGIAESLSPTHRILHERHALAVARGF